MSLAFRASKVHGNVFRRASPDGELRGRGSTRGASFELEPFVLSCATSPHWGGRSRMTPGLQVEELPPSNFHWDLGLGRMAKDMGEECSRQLRPWQDSSGESHSSKLAGVWS